MPVSRSCNGRMCLCAAGWGHPLSAVPTPWERPRAVIEPGGGRLPRHSPLGGGRAPPEGAQQPSGLELTSFLPHSHVLPASSALCLALCTPCSTSQSLPLADKRIYSGRVDAQAAAAAAAGAIARVLGPCGRQQRRPAACFRLSFFGCDRHGVNRCVTAFGGAPGGVPRPGCGWGMHMGRTM